MQDHSRGVQVVDGGRWRRTREQLAQPRIRMPWTSTRCQSQNHSASHWRSLSPSFVHTRSSGDRSRLRPCQQSPALPYPSRPRPRPCRDSLSPPYLRTRSPAHPPRPPYPPLCLPPPLGHLAARQPRSITSIGRGGPTTLPSKHSLPPSVRAPSTHQCLAAAIFVSSTPGSSAQAPPLSANASSPIPTRSTTTRRTRPSPHPTTSPPSPRSSPSLHPTRGTSRSQRPCASHTPRDRARARTRACRRSARRCSRGTRSSGSGGSRRAHRCARTSTSSAGGYSATSRRAARRGGGTRCLRGRTSRGVLRRARLLGERERKEG
ncbi:hypothetical protein C8Q76DRAFT_749974 [Earliella scabrosa]|nr:hypothetical protein C8Q76DRAFT_749974 [Earliella scabrosa]